MTIRVGPKDGGNVPKRGPGRGAGGMLSCHDPDKREKNH